MAVIQSLSKQASKQVKIIGQMDNTIDNTFESANRVYDTDGIAPTMNTCGGGGLQPKILEVKKMNVNELGFIEHGTGKHQSNTVVGTDGISPSITTITGGGTQQIKIVDCQSLRMVRTDEGKALRKAYESGEIHHGFNEYRQAEPKMDGISNTITTVQKDNLILEIKKDIDPKFHDFIYEIDGEFYLIRIRKLTPIECWRLMDFSDTDYKKAEGVNSQTQLYKEAGNSIVKVVLMAIMSQLNIKGVTPWNELSIAERDGLSGKIKATTTDSEDETNGI